MLASRFTPLGYIATFWAGPIARGSLTTWYPSSWLTILCVLSGLAIFLCSGSMAFGHRAAIFGRVQHFYPLLIPMPTFLAGSDPPISGPNLAVRGHPRASPPAFFMIPGHPAGLSYCAAPV